jgi:urease accessory protein
MVLVERIPESVAVEQLAGREPDSVVVTWEQRRWTRGRLTTAGGRELGIALETGTVLQPGSILCVEQDWYAVVEAAEEPTLAITPSNSTEALRVAYEVGNRHFPLALEGGDLLVPDDPAMLQLLERLGVSWERRNAVFAPLGIGRGHGR